VFSVPGTGKTRIGAVAAGELLRTGRIASATVLVPRISLRDHEWPEAFRKFGYEHALQHITLACFQTAYRWRRHRTGLLIVDECHMSLADKFYKMYQHIEYTYLLCLTGTLPEDDMLERLEHYAPVISRCNMRRAEQLGIIARDTTINLGVPLSGKERPVYEALQRRYDEMVELLGAGDASLAYQYAQANIGNYDDLDARRLARTFLDIIRERRTFLANTKFKGFIARKLLERYSDKRAFVFCEDIAYAEAFTKELCDAGMQATIYHSMMKPKERRATLQAFRDGKHRIIVSVRALNVGVDVPDAELGIAIAGSSKSADDTQRRGRVKRFEEGKSALYYNLYVVGTQDERWVTKRTKHVGGLLWQQYIPGENLPIVLSAAVD